MFTNGCFDLVHRGHIELLRFARVQGDRLVVGINTDASVRRLKGQGRPIQPLEDRIQLLTELRSVDQVIAFDELTAVRLVRELRPPIYVKGGEYDLASTEEGRAVLSYGGRLVSAPMIPGRSSSSLVQRARYR